MPSASEARRWRGCRDGGQYDCERCRWVISMLSSMRGVKAAMARYECKFEGVAVEVEDKRRWTADEMRLNWR